MLKQQMKHNSTDLIEMKAGTNLWQVYMSFFVYAILTLFEELLERWADL